MTDGTFTNAGAATLGLILVSGAAVLAACSSGERTEGTTRATVVQADTAGVPEQDCDDGSDTLEEYAKKNRFTALLKMW